MKPSVAIPVAIVIAGALIAGAVYLINSGAGPAPSLDSASVRPVDGTDYVFGNPNAPVVLIEYSDLECPFCKDFHTTMKRIMDEYAASGKVAWVYRHFAIEQLHSKAPKEAEAVECAGELGGNDAFWKYLNRIFDITPSNNNLDLALLPKVAGEIGLDVARFTQCLESGKYASKIKALFNEAVAAGARGTPHTFIAVGGSYLPLEGSQPYASMKAAIEEILSRLPASGGTSLPETQ